MSADTVKEELKNLSGELYSFAYALIPDELMAQQLIVDGLTQMGVKNKSFLQKMINLNKALLLKEKENLKRELFRITFTLSQIKNAQLPSNYKEGDKSLFFQLELEQRAALYLNQHSDYELNIIGYILGVDQREVTSYIYSAKHFMFDVSKDQNVSV